MFENSNDISDGGTIAGQLNASYTLKFLNSVGEGIRLFTSSNLTTDAYRHVNNETIATVQTTDDAFKFSSISRFTGTHFLHDMISGLNPYLFEINGLGINYGDNFANISTLAFVTEIIYPDGSKTEKKHEIKLDIRDIKSFYTRWDVDYGVNGGGNGTDLRTDLSFKDFDTPSPGTELHVSKVKSEAFLSGNDTTVLVHGWNMTDAVNNDWKAANTETMFKRMYWQGYRGEFVAFNWPTFADDNGPRDWPIVGTAANLTYNPSDFQAYRSANALKDVLATYRGTAPNLQPVHLLAHSMGNIVAGEALRLWVSELPFNDDPLVTNYVAMEAAVSAGAYRDNSVDSRTVQMGTSNRPVPDLYRFWSHGRDGFNDNSLGILEYFQGAGFSAEKRVNFYNFQDFALNLWDINNNAKDSYYQSPVWLNDYEYAEGAGNNTNNDIFLRTENGPDTPLTLTLPNGRPGRDAYEILAFFSQSASLAMGTKVMSQFNVNVNLENYSLEGGSNHRANHSYQFNHDAAETWGFYSRLKSELGFAATYGASPLVSAVKDSDEISYLSFDIFTKEKAGTTFVDRGTQSRNPALERGSLQSQHFEVLDRLLEQENEGIARYRSGFKDQEALPGWSIEPAIDIVFDELGQVPV